MTTAPEAKIAITTGADLPDNGSETRVSTTLGTKVLTTYLTSLTIAIMSPSRVRDYKVNIA